MGPEWPIKIPSPTLLSPFHSSATKGPNRIRGQTETQLGSNFDIYIYNVQSNFLMIGLTLGAVDQGLAGVDMECGYKAIIRFGTW